MIGLKDTLTLLKSGMSLQEIKEREALDQIPYAPKADDPAPAPDPEPEPDPEPQGADGESHTESKPEETPDYKKLYETLQKEQEATKQQIKNLQAQINQKDRSGGEAAPYDPQSDLLASLSKFS